MPDDATTVYVVDDDNAVGEALASLLELEGFDVNRYETATAFLSDIDDRSTGVLLLDVRLPDINGLDVQEMLVQRGSKLSVIVITGHGDIPMAVQAVKAGAVNFIEKPFVGDEILDSVRSAESASRDLIEDTKAQDDIRSRLDGLTPRERDVLRHLIVGKRNKIIAYELGISPRTVEVYRANVMHKMQANSLSHLLRMAMSIGLE